MERFKVKFPDKENIIAKRKFIVSNIFPVVIKQASKDSYCILFAIFQNSTEETKYVQMMLGCNSNDCTFLNTSDLYDKNLDKKKGTDVYYLYMENMYNIGSANNIYITDLSMVECTDSSYFRASAFRGDTEHVEYLDMYITRDNFVKINLFLNKLAMHISSAELTFLDKKYKVIEFLTIDHIKLDASSTDIASTVVLNHYTVGKGPTIYKFNYLSPKIKGLKLRNPMAPEQYAVFYSEDFIMNDMIYEPERDILYLVVEARSDITNEYKGTKILRLSKEFYERSNFLDPRKIYEE